MKEMVENFDETVQNSGKINSGFSCTASFLQGKILYGILGIKHERS